MASVNSSAQGCLAAGGLNVDAPQSADHGEHAGLAGADILDPPACRVEDGCVQRQGSHTWFPLAIDRELGGKVLVLGAIILFRCDEREIAQARLTDLAHLAIVAQGGQPTCAQKPGTSGLAQRRQC